MSKKSSTSFSSGWSMQTNWPGIVKTTAVRRNAGQRTVIRPAWTVESGLVAEASDDTPPVTGLLRAPPRPVLRPPDAEVTAPSCAVVAAARTAAVTADPGWCPSRRSPTAASSSPEASPASWCHRRPSVRTGVAVPAVAVLGPEAAWWWWT